VAKSGSVQEKGNRQLMQQAFNRIIEVIFEWIDFALTMLLSTWWGLIILGLLGLYLLGLFFKSMFAEEERLTELAERDETESTRLVVQTRALIKIARHTKGIGILLLIILIVILNK
jgi:hypothetical protein